MPPAPRAKEDRVLTHARRVTALISTLAALLAPVAAIVVDGAKRWPGT